MMKITLEFLERSIMLLGTDSSLTTMADIILDISSIYASLFSDESKISARSTMYTFPSLDNSIEAPIVDKNSFALTLTDSSSFIRSLAPISGLK